MGVELAVRPSFTPKEFPAWAALQNIRQASILTSKMGTQDVKNVNDLWGLFWAHEDTFAKHSQRASERTQRIGRALILRNAQIAGQHIDQDMVDMAATAILTHDIGKLEVDVPSDTKLDELQIQEMARHTGVGERILREMGFPEPIILAAKWHHEINTPEFEEAFAEKPELRALIVLVAAIDIKDAMTDPSRKYRVDELVRPDDVLTAEVEEELIKKLGKYYTENKDLQNVLKTEWESSQDLSVA